MNRKEPNEPESLLNADAAADSATSARYPGDGETPYPERTLPYAGFGIRLAGFLLDMMFLLGISFLIFNPIRRALGIDLDTPSGVDLAEFGFDLLYFLILAWWSGQTLGKQIVGIRVINARQARGKLTLGQVLLREVIGKTLSSIPLFLGYLWVLWNTKKQGWHDLMARTCVVREGRK
ncbi:RDD family protein [Brevibacillus sp. H7]|uniref:RDD family protein n=1 Tax=Brevibacillus sp. H7 TaxID=3349138 RepID=UPI00380F0E10